MKYNASGAAVKPAASLICLRLSTPRYNFERLRLVSRCKNGGNAGPLLDLCHLPLGFTPLSKFRHHARNAEPKEVLRKLAFSTILRHSLKQSWFMSSNRARVMVESKSTPSAREAISMCAWVDDESACFARSHSARRRRRARWSVLMSFRNLRLNSCSVLVGQGRIGWHT